MIRYIKFITRYASFSLLGRCDFPRQYSTTGTKTMSQESNSLSINMRGHGSSICLVQAMAGAELMHLNGPGMLRKLRENLKNDLFRTPTKTNFISISSLLQNSYSIPSLYNNNIFVFLYTYYVYCSHEKKNRKPVNLRIKYRKIRIRINFIKYDKITE